MMCVWFNFLLGRRTVIQFNDSPPTHTHTHPSPGLLTVNAKSRLTLADLSSHPWLTAQSAPSTPLLTSCVLGRVKGTASAINHTFHAFHCATKAGFTLGDVSRAPLLAKRRKRKGDRSPYKNDTSAGDSPHARPSKLDLQTDMEPLPS